MSNRLAISLLSFFILTGMNSKAMERPSIASTSVVVEVINKTDQPYKIIVDEYSSNPTIYPLAKNETAKIPVNLETKLESQSRPSPYLGIGSLPTIRILTAQGEKKLSIMITNLIFKDNQNYTLDAALLSGPEQIINRDSYEGRRFTQEEILGSSHLVRVDLKGPDLKQSTVEIITSIR